MEREEYKRALGKFHKETPEDYQKMQEYLNEVCPHLSEEQRKEAFTKLLGSERFFIACPPVLVKNTLQGVLFRSSFFDFEGHFNNSSLTLGSAVTLEEVSEIKEFGERILYADEATSYAKKHWPKKLIPRNWSSCGQISLHDTTLASKKKVEERRPIATIYVVTARRLQEVLTDTEYPASLVLNADIIWGTIDSVEGSELLAGSDDVKELYSCSTCFSGITERGCRICGGYGVDPYYSWSTILPPNLMAEVIDSGYSLFEEKPLFKAQEEEYQRWKDYKRWET